MNDAEVNYESYLRQSSGFLVYPSDPKSPVPQVQPSRRSLFNKATFNSTNFILFVLTVLIVITAFDHIPRNNPPEPLPAPVPAPTPKPDPEPTPTPTPEPSTRVNPAIEAGKNWRQPLCEAYQEGFTAAADAISEGKSVADADIILKNTADRLRQDSFYRVCSPVLSAIIPEPIPNAGIPDPTKDQLKRFEKALRDLAKGVGQE